MPTYTDSTLAHVAEAISIVGFLRFAGKKAAPLRQGTMQWHHRFSLGSMIASEALKLLPLRRSRKPVRILSAALGLLAGFSMCWAMVLGGHEAAHDPHTARLASRPQPSASSQSAPTGQHAPAGAGPRVADTPHVQQPTSSREG